MMQSGSVISLALRLGRDTPDLRPAFDLAAEYDAHGSALFGFAVNALRDRGLAEDCVQKTYLRAQRARASFDSTQGSARTWLFAIERNVIADVLRSRQRLPRIADTGDVEDRPGENSDTLERLRIAEGLAKLSDEHRMVVVAVHLNGESYAELSAKTGVAIATLRTRAFYALKALRAHIDDSAAGETPSRRARDEKENRNDR